MRRKKERSKQGQTNMYMYLSHAGLNLIKVTLNLLRLGPNTSRQFTAHAAVTGVKKSEHPFLHSTSQLFFVASHLHLYTSHITSHLHITFAHLFFVASHLHLYISHSTSHLHFFCFTFALLYFFFCCCYKKGFLESPTLTILM